MLKDEPLCQLDTYPHKKASSACCPRSCLPSRGGSIFCTCFLGAWGEDPHRTCKCRSFKARVCEAASAESYSDTIQLGAVGGCSGSGR